MADANLVQLQAMLREAISSAANAVQPAAQAQVANQNILKILAEVERRLLQLKGAGFAVTRMDSTLLLLREIREHAAAQEKAAEQQRARLTSLHAGMQAMLG